MKIPIVNEQDEIIEYKERGDVTSSDICRIVGLHVFNEKGEVLVALRHPSKKRHPNKWGPSVSGTVDEGYDYDATVTKEAEEEIGLKNIKPIFYKKMPKLNDIHPRFNSIYYVLINSKEELVIQEDEVSEIRWVSIDDLEDWWTKKPEDFVPSFQRSMDAIKDIKNNFLK